MIAQKLQKVRAELQKSSLKKTGKNQRFDYFELSDFLPKATELFDKYGLCPVFTISQKDDGREVATLTIYSDDEEIAFTCPTAEAVLAGGNPIQQLGAKITYMRRYLYMTALDICENDLVDAEEQEIPKASEKQISYLIKLMTKEETQNLLERKGIADLTELNTEEASKCIEHFKEKRSRGL